MRSLHRRASGLLGAVLGLLMLSQPAQAAPDLPESRKLYARALVAVAIGDGDEAEALGKALDSYPLYPYLRYQILRHRLRQVDDQDILHFIEERKGDPLAGRLREEWLRDIAERGEWQRFLERYTGGGSTVLQCYDLRGRVRNGETQSVAAPALRIWLTGQSQPSACDRLFEWLDQQGYITADLLWKRLELTMNGGDLGVARALAVRMSPEIQTWAQLWIDARAQPSAALQSPLLRLPDPRGDVILRFALKQLANMDPAAAHERLPEWAPRLSAQEFVELQHRVAVRSAVKDLPEARAWLLALPQADAEGRMWIARLALQQQDWSGLVAAIDALEAGEAAMDKWRYWRARALELIGRTSEAQTAYASLAGGRGYYAFLAADRLGTAYALNHGATASDEEDQRRLLDSDAGQRAQELYRLGETTDARREWNRVLAKAGREQHLAAVHAAASIGWLGATVRGATINEALNDLDLRFPLAYQDEIGAAATAQSLDASLLAGLIRRESGYDADARSPAGALGLTQMLPDTARNTARHQSVSFPGEDALRMSRYSIPLGAAYLREQIDRFYGNPVLALAAYNAGPSRVDRWLRDRNTGAADFWVDQIPFSETRHYVQAVLTYATIYDWKRAQGQKRLSERMPAIDAAPVAKP